MAARQGLAAANKAGAYSTQITASSQKAAVTHEQLAASLCQVLGQLLEVDGTSSTTCQGLVKNLR